AEFSQPMNRYTASGKPAARPLKPLVMFLGSNGATDRWPPFLISVAIATTNSTRISKPKKNPASLVDTPTPRNIITMAPAVNATEEIIPAIGLWRDRVAEAGLARAAAAVRAAGLRVSSLCRGGFFTVADPDERR